jgi:hypothetical protein
MEQAPGQRVPHSPRPYPSRAIRFQPPVLFITNCRRPRSCAGPPSVLLPSKATPATLPTPSSLPTATTSAASSHRPDIFGPYAGHKIPAYASPISVQAGFLTDDYRLWLLDEPVAAPRCPPITNSQGLGRLDAIRRHGAAGIRLDHAGTTGPLYTVGARDGREPTRPARRHNPNSAAM